MKSRAVDMLKADKELRAHLQKARCELKTKGLYIRVESAPPEFRAVLRLMDSTPEPMASENRALAAIVLHLIDSILSETNGDKSCK